MATADPQPPPTHPIPPQALQGPPALADVLTPMEWEQEINAEMAAAAGANGDVYSQDLGAAVIAVIQRILGGGDVAPGRQGQQWRPGGHGGDGGGTGGGASGGGMVAA